jgi:hypothetical protein
MCSAPANEEEKMTPTVTTELAYRESAGLGVALLWNAETGELLVTVNETSGDSFALEVDGADALHAFYHPYAYASRLGIPFGEPVDAVGSDNFDFLEASL